MAKSKVIKFDYRVPGFGQGMTLVSTAWLAVTATSLLAPILPQMTAHFGSTPMAKELVQMTVAIPALVVALVSPFLGAMADRVGRRTFLIAGLALYAVAGLAPLWLQTLGQILLSRAFVGVAEAAIMMAGSTLIADYFTGGARDKWYALQTGTTTLVSVVVLAAAGMLGEMSWRMPFWVYTLPLVLLPFVICLIWEPHGQASKAVAGRFAWRAMILPVVLTLFASICFYVVVIQLPFFLTERGYSEPAKLGIGSAVAAIAVPIGSVVFRIMAARTISQKMLVSFALSATGFLMMAFMKDYAGTLAGAFVNGIGSGLALPALLTWSASRLPDEQRGRSVGVWNMAFFMGQFLSPIIVLSLLPAVGGSVPTLLTFSAACIGAALIALLSAARKV